MLLFLPLARPIYVGAGLMDGVSGNKKHGANRVRRLHCPDQKRLGGGHQLGDRDRIAPGPAAARSALNRS